MRLAHVKARPMAMIVAGVLCLALTVPFVARPQVATASSWEGITRVAGSDRYVTAVLASQRYFPSGAQTVLIATGEQWADALCASALAGAYDAPLLLVQSGALPETVRREIMRLGARRVILIGGTAAISNSVRDRIAAIPGVSVQRISGKDRYETAQAIAARFRSVAGDSASGEVFVATGTGFPDALGASAVAAGTLTPIVLTARDSLPAATARALRELAPRKALVLGGTAAISAGTESSVRRHVSTVQRLAGSDRYQTCARVIGYARSTWGSPVSTIGLASGENFPDALAAGAGLGHVGQVQLLTSKSELSSGTAHYLRTLVDRTSRLTVFGGSSAVEQRVLDAARTILNPPRPIVYQGLGDDVVAIRKPEGADSPALLYARGNSLGRHFSIVAYGASDRYVGLLVNTTDPYEGITLMDPDDSRPRTTHLEVSAAGAWYLEVRPLSYARLATGPGTTIGRGDEVLRYSGTSSTVRVVANEASRHFAIVAYGRSGNYLGLLVNTTDSYDGRVRLPAGTYLLEVTGVGEWRLTFE